MPTTVLLVSGASGAGKSTFIAQLLQQTLPDEITRLLPTAPQWSQLDGNSCLKHGVTPDALLRSAGDPEHVVVHYDSTFVWRYGIPHSDDPIFRIVEDATHCSIIVVDAAPEQLANQLRNREHQRMLRRGRVDLTWSKYVRLPLLRLSRKLVGAIKNHRPAHHSSSPERRPNTQWAEFAPRLATALRAPLIYVEPTTSENFRLKEAHITRQLPMPAETTRQPAHS